MAGTGLYMNWVGVTVTPSTGSVIVVDGVTSLTPSRMTRLEPFYGDNRAFPRMLRSVEKMRTITINAGNIKSLLTIPEDVACTVTATLLDPKNGAATGGGALAFTFSNALLEKNDNPGQNNKYAGGTVTFKCYGGVGTDGTEIDPMQTVPL